MTNLPEGTSGRTVLLTGAMGALGGGLARHLAANGHRLILTDMLDCTELANEISDAVVYHERCDLADPDDITAFVDAISNICEIEVLINNATIQKAIPFLELSPESARLANRINVEAPLQLVQLLAPAMQQRRWGRIVNLISSHAWKPNPDMAAYAMSKMGLVGLTRAIAQMFGPDGVTANAISPGATPTPANQSALTEQAWDGILAAQAIKRMGKPEDLAGVVAFLISDAAGFMTGQTVIVDGGKLML